MCDSVCVWERGRERGSVLVLGLQLLNQQRHHLRHPHLFPTHINLVSFTCANTHPPRGSIGSCVTRSQPQLVLAAAGLISLRSEADLGTAIRVHGEVSDGTRGRQLRVHVLVPLSGFGVTGLGLGYYLGVLGSGFKVRVSELGFWVWD